MYHFYVSLRFELFYALENLADPEARVHRAWRERCGVELGEWAGAPRLWPIVADALRDAPLEWGFEELAAGLEGLAPREWQAAILEGTLHDQAVTEELMGGRLSLPRALARVPTRKREWLGFIELYPYRPQSPMARALEQLIERPERFKRAVLEVLRRFWEQDFRSTWRALQPQLRRSLEEKERLLASCTLAEFARHALLRVEVDPAREVIHAVRGGYELQLQQLEAAFFLPSAFNDRRYWCTYPSGEEKVKAYFPFFDPSISLSDLGEAGPVDPQLDPALIFQALGDATRYAIAGLLAEQPRTGAELARALELSKPTVSHHLARLRQAGLLLEHYRGGSLLLSLHRQTLENLSQLALAALYGRPREIKKTRRTSKK